VVENSSGNGVTYSNAYIDASASGIVGTATDFCQVLNNALNKLTNGSNYPAKAGVIDARGVSNLSTACTTTDGNPWAGITNPPPTTVLLPAGTIKSVTPWILPSGTKLVGEGGEDPGLNNNTFGRTIIQAQPNFQCPTGCTDADKPVLTMGVAKGCTGVSIEDLVIDGGPAASNNVDVNGIDNPFCGDQSYVRNVTLFRIVDIGLNIYNSSDPTLPAYAISGPYSNITFDPASLMTYQNSQETTIGAYLSTSTRGIQGMTCTTGTNSTASNTGICVQVSGTGNSIQDVRIEGLSTGVEVSASGVVLMNIDGDTNPSVSSTVLNVVKIDPGKTNVVLIGISNNCTSSFCTGSSPDNSDTTIKDSSNANAVINVTVATDPFVAMYALGDEKTIASEPAYARYSTTGIVSSSSNKVAPIGNWSVGSSTPTTPASGCAAGSLFSVTTGSPALYVCSANSTYYGMWEPVE
jgi:hypothetical protein